MSVMSDMAGVPAGGTIEGCMMILGLSAVLGKKAEGEDIDAVLRVMVQGLLMIGVSKEDIKKTLSLSPIIALSIQMLLMEQGMKDNPG